MGAGRKTQTVEFNSNAANFDFERSQRNLGLDLGGVIFGVSLCPRTFVKCLRIKFLSSGRLMLILSCWNRLLSRNISGMCGGSHIRPTKTSYVLCLKHQTRVRAS